MRNIEYIITAEFHVDKGPSVIHNVPELLPGIENLTFLPEIMLPDQIHKRNEDYTLFLLHRNTTTGEFQYLYDKYNCESEPYFLYTLVNNYKDDAYRRGSSIKAIGIVTKCHFFKNFKPLLIICLDKYFKDEDIRHLECLFNSVNSKDLEVRTNMSTLKKLLITSILDLPIHEKIYADETFRNKLMDIEYFDNEELHLRKDLSFNCVVNFSGMNIPIRVPMISLPDTIGDYFNPTDLNFKDHLINLLTAEIILEEAVNELMIYDAQTPAIILMINAILVGSRVMILSYDNPASDTTDVMLLLLKIVSGGGIISGLLSNYNIFPMIDVSKIELLERCDYYIAATINPFFKHHNKLWDVLYDLDTNEIILSTESPFSSNIRNIEKISIISEDAKFLSNLQLSIYNYNDDLTTLQLIFRRHINEICRILLSSKNLDPSFLSRNSKLELLLEGTGYNWASGTNKLIETSGYQFISKRFKRLLDNGVLSYNLILPNLANEFDLMLDLHFHIQGLQTRLADDYEFDEETIWINILKYLVSPKSLEAFLLVTYLLPPSSASSLQSSSLHDGNLTIFDRNKGIELLLFNMFHKSEKIKSIVIMILQELEEHYVWGWCLDKFLESNIIYRLAYEDSKKVTLSL